MSGPVKSLPLLCVAFLLLLAGIPFAVQAQKNLLELDTINGFGRGLLELYKKYDHLRFSGYLQPQFQIADTAGARTFGGGDFSPRAATDLCCGAAVCASIIRILIHRIVHRSFLCFNSTAQSGLL